MKKFRLCCAALALAVALTSVPLTAYGTEDLTTAQEEKYDSAGDDGGRRHSAER